MCEQLTQKIIAVIGGTHCDEESYKDALQVGREIAKRGGILICGGKSGVMEAACKGAFDEGGLTIGILQERDASMANPWVKIPIPTGLGTARNVIIVSSCSAAIAIDGKYGTLSEIAYCLQHGVPICGLNTWEIKGVIPVSSPEEAVKYAFGEN